jgi:hypothetical protein
MALTIKKLDKIEKSLEGALDAETFEAVSKQIAGVREAINAGETFSKADLNEILGGEVEVTEVPVAKTATETEDSHPLQPFMIELFKALVDETGTIRKGVNPTRMQELFEATYQKMAADYDGAIDAAVEATAIELGKGQRLQFGKSRPAPVVDEGNQTMSQLLKGVKGGDVILKTLSDLTAEVKLLKGERDTAVFTKQAEEIGEGAGFATDLQKLHALDPALATSISKRLGAKNAVLAKSAVWGAELGDGGGQGDGTTAIEKLNAEAREITKSSGGKVSFYKAFAQVCETNPDLYAEYQDEQRRRRG